jgi:hypothetical protein
MTDVTFAPWYNMRTDISSFNRPHKIGNLYVAIMQQRESYAIFPRNYLVVFDENGIIREDLFYRRDDKGNKIDFLAISSSNNTLYGYYELEKGNKSILYRTPINMRDFSLQKDKKQILSGDIRRNRPGPLGDLNPNEAIENVYFHNRLYSFTDFPRLKKTVILKREPDKISSPPSLKLVVQNYASEILHEGKLKLPGSNRHTEIIDIEVNEGNNVYVLTRTKNGSDRDYALTIYDALSGEDRTIRLLDKRYIQNLQLSVLQSQIMVAGFGSEKRGSNKWDVIAATISPDQKSVRAFKTLENESHNSDDIIDIKSAGNTFYLIAKSFRDARYDTRVNDPRARTRFTARETRNTTILALDLEGNQKWKDIIPNFIKTNIYTYDSYEQGYRSIHYDNYLYIEKENTFIVIYCMNPLNDTKPRKNGKMRLVSVRSKKHFGVKAILYNDEGVLNERIISKNQSVVTPIPAFTNEVENGKFFMIGSRYRAGSMSMGYFELH